MAYATEADLAAYSQRTVPEQADRMLERASELIDEVTLNKLALAVAAEETGIDGWLEAAKKAACAQVEFWMETGEESAILSANVKSYSIGNVSVTNGGEYGGGRLGLAPRARRHLMMAGLLYRAVGQ